MTTTTSQLLDLVVGELQAANTAAGARVFKPGDWATSQANYPVLLVRATAEDKESLGNADVQFKVTATIQVVGRVSAPALAADAGAANADEALWALARQVEVAVINAYDLTILLQQFPFVRTKVGFSAEGEQHQAEFVMEIGLEFYQGPEDFCPPALTPITEIDVELTTFPPAGERIALPQ
ncbi:MAG TPA: hypothetical protein VGS12_14525 [Caulobacteraceae bacterium]|nr:hypothetical protein [Caulobacteraceae bacterium]